MPIWWLGFVNVQNALNNDHKIAHVLEKDSWFFHIFNEGSLELEKEQNKLESLE